MKRLWISTLLLSFYLQALKAFAAPSAFTPQTALSASQMNQNFSDLAGQVEALQNKVSQISNGQLPNTALLGTASITQGGTGLSSMTDGLSPISNGTSYEPALLPRTAGFVTLSSGTSWIVPAGVTAFKVTLVGAGGAGGGAPYQASVGAGGGGGAVVMAFYRSITPLTSIPIQIGVAGQGSSGNGGAGGDTSFGGLTAQGGGGGAMGSNTHLYVSSAGSGGACSKNSSITPAETSYLCIPGAPGSDGFYYANFTSIDLKSHGWGGGCIFGHHNMINPQYLARAAFSPTGYCSGGEGPSEGTNTTPAVGANGAPGVIFIEY